MTNPLQRLRRFPKAREGGFALWFAVAVIPITLMVGAATDLRRWDAARVSVQDAADGAVLSAARAYALSATMDPDARLAAAQAAADGAMQSASAEVAALVNGLSWRVEVDPVTRELVLHAEGRMPLAFGGLLGMNDMTVGVAAAADTGLKRLEVALVLDNTGSMLSNDKLGRLKVAANAFVARMSAIAQRTGDWEAVKIGVVPFSATVNVGPENQGAGWLGSGQSVAAYNDDMFDTPSDRFALFQRLGEPWGGCIESRPAPYDVSWKSPRSAEPASLYVPYFAPDEPDEAGYFNSYLADGSSGGADARQTATAKYQLLADARTGPGGPNADCALTPLLPLTSALPSHPEFGRIANTLNAMQAVGNTNIPMGLAWGWNLLSPAADAPLGKGAAYDRNDTIKIVVLMTDGQNNISLAGNHNGGRYSGIGYPSQQRVGFDESSSIAERREALDARLRTLCDAVKDKGVRVYTIGVEAPGAEAVLRDCASSADGFVDVADSAQMDQAFERIANSIVALRLSR